ncbi:phage major capsid protein [Micromonospora craniellae]|uniref:Phage major capsid protein n=1 Tax=Micromonospora craniellae TaxID=2294034 RepID=A0A372G2M3_9ACTN|nr:phage major capsid protein [Micromonospora craniellae]QOC89874.1 phage major capsid protein [Micromonospora craniellae]RFS47019.1 phage major capsid protein [Micromonospora craniellae]
MNLRQQLKAKLARAAELAKAAKTRDLTDDEITEVDALGDEIPALQAKIKKNDAAAKRLSGLADVDDEDQDDEDDDEDDDEPAGGRKTGGARVTDRIERLHAKRMGVAFVKSDAYKAFRKAHPGGVGQGTPINIGRVKVGTMDDWHAGRRRKATLTTQVARIQPTRYPTMDMVERDNLTILDLISRGEADGAFDYVQVTGVTRNAAIVPESTGPADANGLKPVSDLQTQIAEAKPFTYADGYDITNQLLSDAPAFATYMDQELSYSLDWVIEDALLDGSGTGGQPRGLLHTTGVQQLTYTPGVDARAQVKAIRQAITRITRLRGGQVSAVLMAPEDDEAWDLLEDDNHRYLGQGPFGIGPSTSWGRARALSERLAPGTCILGDWRQIALLDVEGLSVLAFNQHKDYAQRNMTYVRAELRAMQVIWKPNRLIVVKPEEEEG